MGKLAIRALTLAIGAAAAAVAPALAPAGAKDSRHAHHLHIKRHGWHSAYPSYSPYPYRGAWVVPQAQPMVRSYGQSDWVCPGIGRSFECKIWPPPFEDDPDRKVSKF